jgi:hypothetical protein
MESFLLLIPEPLEETSLETRTVKSFIILRQTSIPLEQELLLIAIMLLVSLETNIMTWFPFRND